MKFRFSVGEKNYTPKRIFCIGQNYLDHIKEMKNRLPEKLVVFMKPVSSLVLPDEKISFPKHGKLLHYEGEIVILIGKNGYAKTQKQAEKFIGGISLGLDLTMRDLQTELREKGLPWEAAKAFDQSSPIGNFVPYTKKINLRGILFTLKIGDEIKQRGNSENMLFPIKEIIYELSKIWKLQKGDLIYTGTPAGVGKLNIGDKISLESDLIGTFNWEII